MSLSDDLQAVSVDEALIDATSAVENLRSQAVETRQIRGDSYEIELAENIRGHVRAKTGCEGEQKITSRPVLIMFSKHRDRPQYYARPARY